ncbi:MAG: ATP synthase F1 subunit gamma [Actinobacteria bacterium]|nr:ATP synthase F1 subunit gamma [Actinomycetota bacterium]
MAKLKDISRRIGSVANTRKTTKAMEMVAGARLRRAQSRIEALRPYAERMFELMQEVAKHANEGDQFPLLEVHDEIKRVGIVMLTGDRGLAGGFNSNIIRHGLMLHDELVAEGKEVVWIVIGKKGVGTMRFRGFTIQESIQGITDRPKYTDAEDVAHRIATMYAAGGLDKVHLVYNHFKSPVEQIVTEQVILPLGKELVEAVPEPVEEGAIKKLEGDFIYEPNASAILAGLLPTYVDTTIYRALLESTASEHGARMTAMRNASDNAEEMIDKLTLDMNKARQAAITQDILEVVAGAEALG